MKKDSIILTVHNKGWLIDKIINNLFKHTKTSVELNIVLDGCSDNSEAVVLQATKNCPKNFQINILYADNVFETKANNIGLKKSSGDYVIIVQDDMLILEDDWNLRLRKPVESFSDIFAVTAKTAHNWKYNKDNKQIDAWSDLLVDTDHRDRTNTSRDLFAIRNCVNRGPLLIKHDILKEVDYLDEKYSPQLMDDHDLCFRVFKKFGLKCGLYWIDFRSDSSWGSTREGFKPWLYQASHKNYNLLWEQHKEVIENVCYNEERKL